MYVGFNTCSVLLCMYVAYSPQRLIYYDVYVECMLPILDLCYELAVNFKLLCRYTVSIGNGSVFPYGKPAVLFAVIEN